MLSLVPIARPAATAASTSAGVRPSPASTSATDASRKNIPTTSLAALPAWDEFIIGVASTTATPAVAAAPAPRDRPTHHAVNSTSMAQIRFRTGDRVSCLKSTIPSPCSISAVAG